MTIGQGIIVDRQGQVWTLTIDRPERRNALDPQTMVALRDCLVEFRDDLEARVAILSGTGDVSFCAGADLKATLPPARSFAASAFVSDDLAIGAGNYIRALDIERLDIGKPLIAAVNGHAVGGGLELALACDIRLAAPAATFGLPEVKVGSTAAVGGIQKLVRTVPLSDAMSMILTGDAVDAVTALRIGIVSEIVPPGELMARARALAERIARNAPLAVRGSRLLAHQALDLSVRQGMLLEQFVWGALRDTEDRIEGRKAFAEKRPPAFRSR